MRELHLILGYTCNNNCIHCFNKDTIELKTKRGEPLDRTTEEVKEILLQAKKEEVKEITFTGGEPTIRKDFLELLKFTKNLGFKIGLQTNGRAFYSKQFVDKVLKIEPRLSFTVPFHHTNPEIFDQITGSAGSFEQTSEGIKNLISKGNNNITLKTVVLKQNYTDLPKILAFAVESEIRAFNITFPQLCRHTEIYAKDIIPKYKDIKLYLDEVLERSRRLNLQVILSAIPFCFVSQRYFAYMDEINYLKKWVSGDLFKRKTLDSTEDILIDLEVNRRSKPKQCKKCKFYNICLGVWKEYLKLYGDKEFKPVKGEKIETFAELEDLLRKSR